jgi:hypothetical protein
MIATTDQHCWQETSLKDTRAKSLKNKLNPSKPNQPDRSTQPQNVTHHSNNHSLTSRPRWMELVQPKLLLLLF